MGQPLAACCSCRGAPRGLSRLLHAVQGQRLPGGGAAANYHPPTVSAGGVQGGAFPSPVCVVRSNEREGEPARLSLLLLSKADRVTVGQVWGCPPPPLGKVLYI